jgi:outer membrane protein assembly factor BamB
MHRRKIVLALVTWISLVAFASLGSAAEILRWETSPAPGAAIALVGRHVLVGGTTLAAYDARSGATEWEVTSDPPSAISALIADQRRVFAAGVTSAQSELFVGAFDPGSGEQLWSDTVDYPSGVEFAHAMAAGRGRIFVVGTTVDIDAFAASAFIRAYDARTGARLWDDLVPLTPLTTDYLAATEADGQVYLTAGRTGALFGGSPFVIRAYNARTGVLRWQDADPGTDGATVVAADEHRVFTGGTIGDQRGFLVRAYDRRSGRLIWEDSPPGGEISFVTGIALHQGRLVVSGWAAPLFVFPEDEVPNFGSFVRAYDPKTGTVLWQETPFGVGRGLLNLSLAAAHRSVFVAGFRSADAAGPSRFSVRALDIRSGALRWEDLGDGPGIALAVEARAGLAIAVGEVTDPDDGATSSVIRAYGDRRAGGL